LSSVSETQKKFYILWLLLGRSSLFVFTVTDTEKSFLFYACCQDAPAYLSWEWETQKSLIFDTLLSKTLHLLCLESHPHRKFFLCVILIVRMHKLICHESQRHRKSYLFYVCCKNAPAAYLSWQSDAEKSFIFYACFLMCSSLFVLTVTDTEKKFYILCLLSCCCQP
jgi:hypothetical protein